MKDSHDLVLDLNNIEGIEKYAGGIRYAFPTITLGKHYIYYNVPAMRLLGETVEHIRYGFTSQYIVIRPSSFENGKTFVLSRAKDAGRITAFPIQMRRMKVAPGTYRLLTAQPGVYAFDRYSPITDDVS